MGNESGIREQLSRADVQVNQAGPNGSTPLHLAAGLTHSPNPEIARGAYPNARIVKMLLANGADPGNRHAQTQATPLHGAANARVVDLLVAAGGDVMARDAQGNTPLHYTGSPQVARALLDKGADTEATNMAGQTPLQTARLRQQQFDRALRNANGVQSQAQRQALAQQARQFDGVIAVLSGESGGDGQASTGRTAAATSGDRLEHLAIDGNGGEYMCPWTSDGVLADWVDKAINAKMGAAAGSAVGAYAGQKAMEQVPLIGGFLGSKVGDAAGRKIAIEAAGGEEYIRTTSDLSFNSLNAMARYIKANYAGDRHFQDAVEAADEIYPGLQQAVASAR